MEEFNEQEMSEMLDEDILLDIAEEARGNDFLDSCRLYGLNPRTATWDDVENAECVERIEQEKYRTYRMLVAI